MKVQVLDIKGKSVNELDISLGLQKEEYNVDHIAYLIKVKQDADLRRGTHSTKTKGEVSGGGAKPYKQKGTGKARRGSNRTPLRVGGGVSFGPKPRDYSVAMNRKMVKLGYKLVTRDRAEQLCVIDETSVAPKSKSFKEFLKLRGVSDGGKVLVVVSESSADDNVVLASRNLEGVLCTYPTWIPIEWYVNSELVVFTSGAFSEIEEKFLK